MKYSDLPLIVHGKNLYPICRSIMGPGIRASLEYFETYSHYWHRISIPSGTICFDWVVPLEWEPIDSYILHLETDTKYASFTDHNLHLISYSTPINKVISLDDLSDNIYCDPENPDWIPYMTSYYYPRWGFCMSSNQKDSLPAGDYRVYINTNHYPGSLDISHALLPGKSQKEIFISSYLCHPSMVNNELSGPLVLNALLEYLQNAPSRSFSYRFVLLPETIGSIAYLSLFGETLKSSVISGFNLSCIGDERAYSYVQSPSEATLSDFAIKAALIGKKDVYAYSYLQRGSDERQYCSPHFNLPLITFCRSKFGTFPEYHTSADDFNLVTEDGLQGSLQVLRDIVDAFETCLYPFPTSSCEPQLSKRKLYPNISTKIFDNYTENIVNILAYADGNRSIFEISILLNQPLRVIIDCVNLLLIHDLLRNYRSPLNL